jgi:hypothetical protein
MTSQTSPSFLSVFGGALPVVRASVFALSGALLLSSCGVHQVVPAAGVKSERRGASYYLPRTVVVANVPVKRIGFEKGEFHFYCEPLLRIKPNKVPASFSVGEDFTMDLAGERDPEHRYVAVYPSGPFKTFTQTLALNEQGVLTKGEASVENKTVDFIVSTLEAGAKVASSAIKAAAGDGLFEGPGLKDLLDHVNSLDNGPDLTIEGLKVGLTVLLADDPETTLKALKAAAKPVGTDDAETQRKKQLASAALEEWDNFVKDCPRGRVEMTNATRAYKDLLAATEALEKATSLADRNALRNERDALLARFMGKKSERVWVGQFRWTPPKRAAGKVESFLIAPQTLFTIEADGGIVSYGVRPETPAPREFREPTNGKKYTTVTLSCRSEIPEQTAAWEQLGVERARHGWHYRIPAQARISLAVNGSTRFQRRALIAQHGCVAFVPATSYGQKIASTVELDPITGGLKSVTHGGQAFDPAMMTKLGTAAAGVIDAESERAAAKAAASDPVAQLERKKKLLELQRDVKALEAASGG